MYVRRQKTWTKHLDFMILDVICLVVSFYLGYIIRHGFGRFFHAQQYIRLLFIMIAIDLCVALFTESYKSIVRRGYISEIKHTVKHVGVIEVLMLVYLFAIHLTTYYSRQSLILTFIMQLIFTYGIRIIRKHQIRKKMRKGVNAEYMVIITDKKHVKKCIRELKTEEYRNYRIVAVDLVDADEKYLKSDEWMAFIRKLYKKDTQQKNTGIFGGQVTVTSEEYQSGEYIYGVPVLAGFDKLSGFLLNNIVDSVFCQYDMQAEQKNVINDILVNAGVTVHSTLALMPKDMSDKAVEKIGNYVVITTGQRIVSGRQLFIKRCMDIAGAIVGLVITAVLTIIFAPIIFVQSPGPIFFSQERMGQNGRRFKIHKFRTMYPDAEERKAALMAQNKMDGLMFKMDNDPRIIPIGKVLRKYSLDEFPQFLNVLVGEMTLVGTRPPTAGEYEQYELHHKGRLGTKPGITGRWQVSGRSDITDFEEVVRLDTAYIEDWSVAGDIRILCKTVMQVFKGSGAE